MLVGEAVRELRSDSPSQRIIDAVSSMLLIAECFEMEDAFKDGKVSFERLSNSSNYRGKDLGSYIALSNGFIYNTHGYYSSVSAAFLAGYLEAFHKLETTYGVETVMNLILEQYDKCFSK